MLKEDFIKQFVSDHSVVYFDDIKSGIIEKEIVNGTFLVVNAEVKVE